MNDKAFVVIPDLFGEMLEKFLERLKKKKIVKSFSVNERERVAMIAFTENAEIPETKEDLITKGIFKNAEAILKDLGYDDVHLKTITLPVFSTQEDNGNVIVNY